MDRLDQYIRHIGAHSLPPQVWLMIVNIDYLTIEFAVEGHPISVIEFHSLHYRMLHAKCLPPRPVSRVQIRRIGN